jgi:nicotinate-nucleotide pyrophosphorylase (carboxylating)
MAEELEDLARVALAEDAPGGDVTSAFTVPADTTCVAEVVAKQDGVVAGVGAATAMFAVAAQQDGVSLTVDPKLADGDAVHPGDRVLLLEGPARTILRAERPALNVLGHLSGIATLTRRYVDSAAPAHVLCTRKTTPGLRGLERAAVEAGGGTLHRASLSDAILIKDTHVRLAGGVGAAVRRAKAGGLPIEVEVETIGQLEEALAEGAERILLDNPSPALVAEAIDRIGEPMRLEVSGGVTLENIGAFVEAGARVVSVGRLTHSAPSLDLSLEVIDTDA